MFARLYQWTLSLAQSPHAVPALALISFAESSFFPLPPDLILIPMSVARPGRALSYAVICTIASVLGGVVGYMIGAFLFDTWGHWIISLYGYSERVAVLKAFYDQWGWAFILIKGVTPIPYKLVTIVSGALEYNLTLFILFSVLTRGARFFVLAGILRYFGDPIREVLERYFALFLVGIIFLVIFGFWISAYAI